MRMEYQKQIFGHVFKLANNLQTYLDRNLENTEITSKQMLLMIIINTFEDQAPTLQEVARKWGSSYQNVKQLALKLQKNGFVDINDHPDDKRKKQLVLSGKAKTFWHERSDQDTMEMNKIYNSFSDEELRDFLSYILKLQKVLEAE